MAGFESDGVKVVILSASWVQGNWGCVVAFRARQIPVERWTCHFLVAFVLAPDCDETRSSLSGKAPKANRKAKADAAKRKQLSVSSSRRLLWLRDLP